MLNHEQNEILTRVEGDAPMARYLRETSWIPAIISSSLVVGHAPYGSRLLGENYVAFRAPDGRVGFFSEYCPHRGASLLLARAEGDSLRCIFHGWKYRVDGVTVEVPTQSRDHDAFCKKVPLEHFPTREAAGIVWVWLGKSEPGPFRVFPFTNLVGEHVFPVHSVLQYNWLQALEGLVDSAHVSILHSDWLSNLPVNPKLANAAHDKAPIYEFEDGPDRFRYAAIRRMPEGRKYVRITEFIGPWYTFTPGDQGSCFICVPIDDDHTAHWSIRHDPKAPIQISPLRPAEGDPMDWPPPLPGARAQRWGQDRDAMQRGSFSGFTKNFFHEDVAVAASMGTRARRNKEFLNSGDQGVVRMRNLLLRAVRKFDAGKRAASELQCSPVPVTAAHGVIDADADWRTASLR